MKKADLHFFEKKIWIRNFRIGIWWTSYKILFFAFVIKSNKQDESVVHIFCVLSQDWVFNLMNKL